MNNEDKEYLSRIQKVILMLLFVDGVPLKGKTWFQKEIFLISKLDEQIREEIEFEPHNYGPHSYEAEESLESLEEEGLVDIIGNSEIKLTDKGKDISNLLRHEFPDKIMDFYKEIKNFLNDLSKMELLAFIYQTNKEMTTQSVELDNVRSRLIEYAISLYRKEKLSLVKAAEIAELQIKEFISELKERGIRINTGI